MHIETHTPQGLLHRWRRNAFGRMTCSFPAVNLSWLPPETAAAITATTLAVIEGEERLLALEHAKAFCENIPAEPPPETLSFENEDGEPDTMPNPLHGEWLQKKPARDAAVALLAAASPEDLALVALRAGVYPVDQETGQIIVPVDDPGVDPIAGIQAPVPIPDIDRAQLRLWMLLNKNVTWAQILASLDLIEDPIEREAARIEMEDRKTFKRSHPLFEQLGPSFDMTSADMDQAFREASLL